MKKTTLFLAISMILISIFTSCKKDDSTSTTTTTITKKDTLYYVQYDGKKYEVDKCHAFYDAIFSYPDAQIFNVKIASKDVMYDDFLNHFIGYGDGFVFKIATNSAFSIIGNFNVDTINNTIEAWELYGARMVVNSSFGPLKGGSITNIKSGSCSITQPSANVYLINGSFTTIDGKAVKVNYKGAIPLHTAN